MNVLFSTLCGCRRIAHTAAIVLFLNIRFNYAVFITYMVQFTQSSTARTPLNCVNDCDHNNTACVCVYG